MKWFVRGEALFLSIVCGAFVSTDEVVSQSRNTRLFLLHCMPSRCYAKAHKMLINVVRARTDYDICMAVVVFF